MQKTKATVKIILACALLICTVGCAGEDPVRDALRSTVITPLEKSRAAKHIAENRDRKTADGADDANYEE